MPITRHLLDALAEAQRPPQRVTGAEIARRTGGLVSRSTVSSILRGRQRTIEYGRLVALADALDIDPAKLSDVDFPQPWVLPPSFDWVPLDERAELERLLAWLLDIRHRT